MATGVATALGHIVGNLGAMYAGKKVADATVGFTKTTKKSNGKRKLSARNLKKYRKKRTFKRRRKSLRSELYKLKRLANRGVGTYTYRQRQTGRLLCSVNSRNTASTSINGTTNFEEAINNLPTFNPATPGTYTFVDFTAGSLAKSVECIYHSGMMVMKNNYNIPVKATMWCCYPKGDTSIHPDTAWNSGLADVSASATRNTPMCAPMDSPHFRDLWVIHKKVQRTLKAGESLVIKHTVGRFSYDPTFHDEHALLFQTRYKSYAFMYQVEGVLAHDTTADQQGNANGGVDWQIFRKYVVQYEAGADIEYKEYVDDNDPFTNGAVVASYSDVTKESYAVN